MIYVRPLTLYCLSGIHTRSGHCHEVCASKCHAKNSTGVWQFTKPCPLLTIGWTEQNWLIRFYMFIYTYRWYISCNHTYTVKSLSYKIIIEINSTLLHTLVGHVLNSMILLTKTQLLCICNFLIWLLLRVRILLAFGVNCSDAGWLPIVYVLHVMSAIAAVKHQEWYTLCAFCGSNDFDNRTITRQSWKNMCMFCEIHCIAN